MGYAASNPPADPSDLQTAPMAYRTFDICSIRGLSRATAHDLPDLVVIAGPNGAGKSTLLEELAKGQQSMPEPGTRPLWIGPHRGWDQLQVQRSALWDGPPEPLIDSLTQQLQPGNGMQVGWQFGQTIKTYLVRLHAQQRIVQDEILHRLRQHPGESIGGNDVPDLLQPFKDLVRAVLPHLRFQRVLDLPAQHVVQCLFEATDGTGSEFELEQLSSGEKATIALLIPFLQAASEEPSAPSLPGTPNLVPLTVLIDEVDQHLHPLLQLQVLQYLRDRAAEGAAQFIVTTHSPALLDAVTDDELYLLSPPGLRPGENQLTRLTTKHERLEVARELTGSTHLLTRAKPIVFVEGESDRPGVSSDAHLITLLLPQTATWALVPARSRSEVEKAVRTMRNDQLDLPGTPVFGLVDADRDADTGDDHVIAWPVAMIENLLLDAEAIYQALSPYGRKTGATSPRAVQDALNRAARDQLVEEVRLRLDGKVKPRTPQAGVTDLSDLNDLDGVAARTTHQVEVWLKALRALNVAELRAAAEAEVQAIIAANQQLDRFHGKKILEAAYRDLGVGGVFKFPDFPSAIAVHAAGLPRTRRLTAAALQRIALYFPNGLAEELRGAGGSIADALARECDIHRAAWRTRDGGGPLVDGQQSLRRDIFEFARTLGDQHRRERLVQLAAEIGTP